MVAPDGEPTWSDDPREQRAMLVEAMKDMLTPIDFGDLVKRGVLRKVSLRQYEVLQAKKVPRHVMRQATAAKFTTNSAGKKTRILTFRARAMPPRQEQEMRKLLHQAGEA